MSHASGATDRQQNSQGPKKKAFARTVQTPLPQLFGSHIVGQNLNTFIYDLRKNA